MNGSSGIELKSTSAIFETPVSLISPATFIVTGMVGVLQPQMTAAPTAAAEATPKTVFMFFIVVSLPVLYFLNEVEESFFAPDLLTFFAAALTSSMRLTPSRAPCASALSFSASLYDALAELKSPLAS